MYTQVCCFVYVFFFLSDRSLFHQSSRVLVVNCFYIFETKTFYFVVAMSDLVHDVEIMHCPFYC